MKNWAQSTLLIFVLSFFASTLHAKVGPVVPGQSLWCVTKSIGSTADVISSKLATLNFSLFDYFLSSKIDTIIRNSKDTVTILNDAMSQLDSLSSCPVTKITTPTTISASGVYCLHNNIVGPILIQANDVVVNLNSHLVTGNVSVASNQSRIIIRNGVVDNNNAQGTAVSAAAGTSDITIQNVVAKNALVGIGFTQVFDGLVEGCTLTQNTTGMQLTRSRKIVVEESTADGNRNAGFDLIASTTCTFSDCTALATGRGNTSVINNTVIGFSASQGNGNIFERCIANSTQALSTTDYNSVIAGFALRSAESCTKIIECESANATTSAGGVTIPYGILLQAQFSGLVTVTAINPGAGISNDTIWEIAWSPDGLYLAAAGSLNASSVPDLYVYRFDRVTQTLQQIVSVNVGDGANDNIYAINWSPDGNYLAVGGDVNSTAVPDLFVYRFDRASETLQQVDSINPGGVSAYDGIYAISWSPDGNYLATGGVINGTVVAALYLYKFNKITQKLQQVDAINPGGGAGDTLNSLGWSPDGAYLAAGGSFAGGGDGDLIVYKFERSNERLFQVDAVNPGGGSTGDAVRAISWSFDGQYLAIGIGVGAPDLLSVFVYRFNRTTQTLQQVDGINPRGATVDFVLTAGWSPDGQYLAVGLGFLTSGGNDLLIYRFDRGSETLQQVDAINPTIGTNDNVYQIAWSPDGQYLAVGTDGVTSQNSVFIYQALTFPSNNVITRNTVYCNSGARYPSGVGISGSSIANLIIQNTAYCNPLCQAPNQPIVESNYCFACNVFNSLFGQAPTNLQNISISCCEPITMPIDPGLLMKQTLYTESIVQSELDVVISILDNITTPTALTCSPTPITTSPTTLTGPGIYCIASNSIAGLITIDGSDVVLDLNNRTITGGIDVVGGRSRVTIEHGVVSREGSNAININPGCADITIKKVVAKNSIVGIAANRVTGGLISNCTMTQNTTGVMLSASKSIIIQDSNAESNRVAGFDLVNSLTCCVSDCNALNCGQGNTQLTNNNVFGFVARNGYGNIFERCIANATQALSTTDFSSVVAGFALRGTESSSKIIGCESSNCSTAPSGVTVPYGILIEKQLIPGASIPNAGFNVTATNTPQTSWSPDGKYFAANVATLSPNGEWLVVFEFDRIRLQVIQRAAILVNNGVNVVTGIDWSPQGDMIVVNDTVSSRIAVYQFQSINNTLTQVASQSVALGTPFNFPSVAGSVYGSDVEWSPDANYIAVADGLSSVIIYSFNSVSFTIAQVASNSAPALPIRLSWSPDGNYVAVADFASVGMSQLQIYNFNKGTSSLGLSATSALPRALTCIGVDWHPNGKYLVVGGDDNSIILSNIFVFQFNRNNSTLTYLNEPARPAYRPIGITWSPDGTYIAFAGNPSGFIFTNETGVYTFDPGTNVVQYQAAFIKDNPVSVAWSPDGGYFVIGDNGTDSGTITTARFALYNVLSFPSNNVIKNNTVYGNSGGILPQGVGISGSSIANMIIQNTAYANPLVPFAGIGSNYQFTTNVFNPQFGQAPTLLQNISLDANQGICMPVDMDLVLNQALSKTSYLVNFDMFRLASAADNITFTFVPGPCDPTSITTGTTLSLSGIYCLANSISGIIQISGSDIFLNLNNYKVSQSISISNSSKVTVLNGQVENTLGSGGIIASSSNGIEINNVRVTNSATAMIFSFVNDALIKNCNVSDSLGGISLSSCSRVVIENTVAEKISQKGFALINSTTCCLRDCQALGIGNTNLLQDTTIFNGIIGFDARGGYGNIFERCIANSTQGLTVTSSLSIVAGFRLAADNTGRQERATKIIECESSNATTSPNGVTIPYGILLQATLNSSITLTAVPPLPLPGDTVNAISWSPDGIYLAVGLEAADTYHVRVYEYDRIRQTLTQVAIPNISPINEVNALAWRPDGRYLLVGGRLNNSIAYDFNPTNNTLKQAALVPGIGTEVFSLDWSPGGMFVATGDGATTVKVFQFNAVALSFTQVASVVQATDIQSVKWSPDGRYLATTDATSPNIRVYRFSNNNNLTLVADATGNPAGSSIVDWSPDGRYLASGSLSTPFIRIYRFNPDSSVLSLAATPSPVPSTGGVFIDWSADGRYLATDANGGTVYLFDRSSNQLTVASTTNIDPSGAIFRVQWSPDNGVIAVGNNAAPFVMLYQALNFPSNNVIENNTVYCNSGASIPSGIGISGSSIANIIIQNTVYADPINVFMTGTNYACVTNVFNQLFGQGPSLLQNISLDYRQPIVQPGDLGLILDQIRYEVENLGCDKIILTSSSISGGTISLTSSGAYCLSTDLTADLIISATAVTVDLNNRILTGRVTIQQGTNSLIQDGRVVAPAPTTSGDAAQAAITIASNTIGAHVERVIIRCQDTATTNVAGRAGIELQGNDAQIIGCTIRSGSAGNSSSGIAPDGADGIRVTTNAARGLITGCLIKTGAGGNSSVSRGGNGGHGVNVGASTETKIIKNTIIETGAGGTGAGASAGGIGGHGVNVQGTARKTLVTKLIIRNTGISGLPESRIDVPITEGGSVNIPLRSRAINDLIPTTVNGISSMFANTAYKIYDSARPYIFQSQLDTLSQGNPSSLQPTANEVSGEVVTGWSPVSNVVFQSVVEVLS